MWYFYSSNIMYGGSALNCLENITGNKCFIITDKIIEEIGHLKILTDKLEHLGKEWEVFDKVVPDPHEEDVLEATEVCKLYNPDLIIALGGGSVMDTAKTVWVLYEFPDLKMEADIHPFNRVLFDLGKKAKLIAIPTTSGTGSEVSCSVVISKKEEDGVWRKMELIHIGLKPDWAIVDPIFPARMPPQLTANTGFDAVAHCFESINSQWRSDFSNALALKAVEFLFKYLPIAYKDGKNMEARDYMHQAATMAGLVYGNSLVHIGHSLGHAWGAVFNIPHGRCVGTFLPYILQYCFNDSNEQNKSIEIIGTFVKRLGWAKWVDDIKKAAYITIDKVRELQRHLNFSSKLKDLGIPRKNFDSNLDTLVKLCFQSPILTNCPRTVNHEDLPKLFAYAYEGKDIDF